MTYRLRPASPAMISCEQKVQGSSSCSFHETGCLRCFSLYIGILKKKKSSNASKGMDLLIGKLVRKTSGEEVCG